MMTMMMTMSAGREHVYALFHLRPANDGRENNTSCAPTKPIAQRRGTSVQKSRQSE
jgi:hypothetical protein